jgi:two-component system, LytTR family, response regulator
MIRALIIDDEPASVEALLLKIQKVSSEIEVVRTFYSALEAIDFVDENPIDIIFLDIEMPEMDGFTFLEQFPERTFEVIITTAHNEHAITAVRQSVLDFLLKPISISELSKAIDRLKLKQLAKAKPENTGSLKINALFDKLPVSSMKGLVFVPVKDILYLESGGNYTTIYIENRPKLVSSRSLGDYEALLSQLNFLRIHHSVLINLAQIREYIRGDGGTVILVNGTELQVAKRKKTQLLEMINF